MKIYFAGSIRGRRDDKELYAEIVKKLTPFGAVLTEHVVDKNVSSDGEINISERDIYARDVEWLMSSDIVIAEVTTPSLGVGYELGLAEKLNKKILCIYREQEGKRLSAMIGGNPKITVKLYKDPGDLDTIFGEFFKS
jgi:nucleoside 2-deoxyribosyltransferase